MKPAKKGTKRTAESVTGSYTLKDKPKKMADSTGVKRPAPGKATSFPKDKRRRLSPRKERTTRSRVDIGLAIKPWRALKARKGWKSDAEVALRLLDGTKTLPTALASPGADDEKIKFSQSKMQTLIEQEFETTLQKKESKLKALMDTIEKLDRNVDYMSSIQKLQTRINTVTKRAEAAIAFMTKKKSRVPRSVVTIKRCDSKDETMETAAQTGINSTNCMDDKGEVFKMMENTKQALQNIYSDNEALNGAMEDLKEELPPPVLTHYGSPEAKVGAERPKEEQVENTEPVQSVEPKVGPVKVERLPLCESDGPNNADSEQDEPLYPPLPTQTIPVTLNTEAALYNIPLRLMVRLALIRNTGLSLLWNTEEEDACGPPMGSYSVFITVEKKKGSNVFPDWTLVQVEAKPLPMCMMISKYKSGRKVCVAVVGKDKFGRFGPHSSVETASLPD